MQGSASSIASSRSASTQSGGPLSTSAQHRMLRLRALRSARLADYQLAIFVSANAVSATRALMPTPWPASTMIGAVGAFDAGCDRI